MGLLASTVAELGTPSVDGAEGIVQTASGQRVRLRWHAGQGAWVSRPRMSMRQVDDVGMAANGAPSGWKYPNGPENPIPVAGPVAFGFQIHKLLGAGELWAAGLRLQEHLTAEIHTFDLVPPGNPELALNWYELATGDNFLSPIPDNQGVRLVGDRDQWVYRHFSSGWQNSPVRAPAAGKHWYPELYLLGPVANFRNFTARHRWAAGNLGAAGGSEAASKFPPLADVISWNLAEHIPVADGAPVAEWPDYSGRGRSLLQPTAAKQPVVQREAFRYVRFDGVDDLLTSTLLAAAQPVTVFLVMRQNAGGGAQQVWLGPSGAGASLLYRGDATDQVNVWAGGTDLIYHRAAPWPTPWIVWSVVLNGAATTVWEGKTQVAAGDAGATGLTGITLGSNAPATLPAKLDVAELIVSFKAATTPERNAVIDQLNAKYGL